MIDTPKDGLTDDQSKILLQIILAADSDEPPPTVRELAKRVGRSTGTITARLRELEALGRIRRDPSRQRHIRIIRKPKGAAA